MSLDKDQFYHADINKDHADAKDSHAFSILVFPRVIGNLSHNFDPTLGIHYNMRIGVCRVQF